MKIEKDLEDLLLNLNLKTDIDVLILEENKIIYFVGNTEKSIDYLYKTISNDLKRYIAQITELAICENDIIPVLDDAPPYYMGEAIYRLKNTTDAIVFLKRNKKIGEEDIILIKAMIYLVDKFLK